MCATHEWPLADVDTRLAMQQAAMRLAQAGVPVRDVQTPMLFSQLLQVQKEIMAYELARSLSHERLRHAGQLSDKLQALLDEGMRIAPERHWANIQLAYSARAKVSSAFGDSEAWLAPSAIGEAPATLEQTGDPVFGRIWTLLGLPCVHLPFTTGQSGMPVGLQLVGRYGDDRVVLRIARWLMQHLAAKS
jgi:Asp-tRNA(Asn)/Glu-tRNA(Gln) amidotransferase A subunit family amidase